MEIGGPYKQTTGPAPESLRKIFTCGHLHGGHSADCARKIVSDFGGRAFRRPLTPQEINRFTGLVSLARRQGDSFDEGICLAMQGILVSPHFLFRIERDPVPTAATAAQSAAGHPISQQELASRLSYFLWSSMPDDALRRCADSQTLRNPGVLESQVRRMLKDPKSSLRWRKISAGNGCNSAPSNRFTRTETAFPISTITCECPCAAKRSCFSTISFAKTAASLIC